MNRSRITMDNTNSNTTLRIAAGWQASLSAANLASYDELMGFAGGQLLSQHKGRSQVYRTTLAGGQDQEQVVFVKKALGTEKMEILRDIARFRRPGSMVHKEQAAMEAIASLGVAAPEIIAFGQRRIGCWPTQGVMVTLKLPGRPMDEIISAGDDGLLAQAFGKLGLAMARVHQAGLCWPDLLPRHVYILDDGRVGFLDVERMQPPLTLAGSKQSASLRRFLSALAKVNASQAQIELARRCLAEAGCAM
jgi:hypothetical protein